MRVITTTVFCAGHVEVASHHSPLLFPLAAIADPCHGLQLSLRASIDRAGVTTLPLNHCSGLVPAAIFPRCPPR